jgi:hypothetical protein
MTSAPFAPRFAVVMKVGYHAAEDFSDIIDRKLQELRVNGRLFWGYGGSCCHPLRQVQPLAELASRDDEEVACIFTRTFSRPSVSAVSASRFSADGERWRPLPPGVDVRGSKFALVLTELVETQTGFDLSDYEVAVGPSAGRPAVAYMRGRIDKACLRRLPARASQTRGSPDDGRATTLVGRLAAPYAVVVD